MAESEIVGYVYELGYAYCVKCHVNSERKVIAILYADNAAVAGDRCDRCDIVFPCRK